MIEMYTWCANLLLYMVCVSAAGMLFDPGPSSSDVLT
jgi:hypothetical protein